MIPTAGRIVLYKLNTYDAGRINQWRDDAGAFNRSLLVKPEPGERGRSGHVLHTGNPVQAGEVYPALVVRVFGPPESPDAAVNLKVQLDGDDDYWATSRGEGSHPGQWAWPPRAEATVMTGIADKVHYFSHGTPPRADGTQAYAGVCRAAIVTEVGDDQVLGLMVCNPTGQFFNQATAYHDGRETPGNPDCPDPASHGNPFRYCACGWMEASYQGGTWHRADHR